MEAQDRPQPGTKPSTKPSTNRVRPGKGDVKWDSFRLNTTVSYHMDLPVFFYSEVERNSARIISFKQEEGNKERYQQIQRGPTGAASDEHGPKNSDGGQEEELQGCLVSVVNMCGHSSSILGKLYQQTALPSNSIRTSRGTESTTPTTLQAGTPHSSARERQDRSRVWPCGQRLRGSLRPLCIVEVSSPTVEQCRGIQPLCQPLRTKKNKHQSAPEDGDVALLINTAAQQEAVEKK
ncbi:uncharacterized protein LOC121532897 [Coregonus clupeaformis]|uniref:uncharacterized protein LOC121532897 n=1 Tax=Coregonus clupeaformis TaxID=59861 RepID=UPI001BE0A709|nr:uncharacterized protein LOC121532897 [Coregonus clupeaformis]